MSRIHPTWSGCAVLLTAVLLGGPDPLAADTSGWQVDLKYGQSSFEGTFGRARTKLFDDHADAAGVEVGYRFNEYIALQAGYHDFGTFQGFGPFCADDDLACIEYLALTGLCAADSLCLFAPIPFEAEVTGWSLAAVPSWPFTNRFSAYGKLGLLDWESDVSPTGIFGRGVRFESLSDTDLLTAIGLRYRFHKSLGALLEYQRLDLDLGSTSLGLSWTF